MSSAPQTDPALAPFAGLLDALNCGALILDREGNIVHANARLAHMMRRPRTDLIGANIKQFYPEEAGQKFIRESLSHFDERREEEFYIGLPDGQRLPIISSARPLPANGALSDYRIVTAIDISPQKQAESQLQEQYDHMVEMSDTVLHQAIELKNHNRLLEQRVRERTADLHAANLESIFMLAVASEAKDGETGRHVRRIQYFAKALGQRLGMNDALCDALGYSALLHDVGKIHIPDAVLTKPGPLDDAERKTMREHTTVGEHILSSRPFFETARHIARHHHENWDGTGYPDGLAGDAIPLAARITHVVDVFDALTTRRVYKPAWSRLRAVEAIHEGQGTLFDPDLVAAFAAMLRDGDVDRILRELGQDEIAA